ncbi:MAG TPA: S46 family peptidase [Myxococcales bacterium]|nr:S46 family peptidase [Myxococcales bacterium]
MNRPILLAALVVFALAARADEGMWTFDNFPAKKVQQKYRFAPDAQWLNEAQLSSVRLAGGCSGSFVSPDGLVMTNHHCAHSCIEQLSTMEKDFVALGFYAPSAENEVKCPEIELNQLVQISDVTARIQGATKGLKPGKEFNDKRKAAMATAERECAGGDDKLRCDVVELYHGGQYSLYRYKRFQDVRLVFAPEFAIAFFGGDPDNFNFPRYDLDVSFIRAYENDKPARTEHYFKWSPAGAKDGDLTFVSGNPGGTDRELTMAELQYQRDFALPARLFDLAQYRGALTMYTARSPEDYRVGEKDLFYVENSYKALKGRFEALVSPTLWNQKAERERALRAKVNGRPALRKKYGSAWDDVAKAVAMYQPRRIEYKYVELGSGFNSPLYRIARDLLRGTEELQKPNEQRLREYTDARLPQLKQRLFSQAPIYEQFELFKLSYGLTKLREELGADHPFVKKVLGKRSPQEVAQDLVKSKLYDPKVREQLWQGGRDAVQASTDPMIELAKLVDADARPLRKWHDEEVETLETSGAERIAAAKFELEGKSNYPDATFTPRLSYGAVKGFMENGQMVEPFTTMAGAFDRATGRDPFKLPDSWLRANENKQIDGSTPFNFCTTNDIIGGNSGSPVFDKDRQIVGLVFDGNIHSLGGDYGFDATLNRTVAVHSAALLEALDHIYGAKRIVAELKGAPASSSASGSK